ncbi:unnamed protein product [Thlaspi arvense]|uniref:Complex III subunit VII n=1 Tax=Thlaspi arvense TaxID=13288 RepID=A0AAU9SBI9_THLAR|nr:unnamed protein product [Thlaspi arvense]
MSSFLKSFIDPSKNFLARMHMRAISTRLRRYGQISSKTLVSVSEPESVSDSNSLIGFAFHDSVAYESGLRYDDLYDQYYSMDIKEAMNRLPREVVDARNQRLKRAMDLSMKHEYLPKDLQAVQTPFRGYLQEMLALVEKERLEREALGALPLYQRTLP